MKLYTSPGGVACGSCGYAVRFDEGIDWRSGVAHGRCISNHCEHRDKVFKFPLSAVEVEFIAPDSDGGECD